MEDHELISARFVNDEKDTIEILWKSPKDEIRPEYIEVKDGSPQYEELLKLVSLDEIHEMTFKWIKDQREEFEKTVMKIAEEEGLVQQKEKVDHVDLILQLLTTKEVDKEMLFKLKLALFELDAIKKSKKRSFKTDLRKAENITKTIAAYSKFIEE